MIRELTLPALVAACLIAGCTKSEPETGAAPAKDSTMTADKMAKDSAMMAKDSAMMAKDSSMKMDSTKMMSDSTKMMTDSTMTDSTMTDSTMTDSTMHMPADSSAK